MLLRRALGQCALTSVVVEREVEGEAQGLLRYRRIRTQKQLSGTVTVRM